MAQNKWIVNPIGCEEGIIYHITNGEITLAVNHDDVPGETVKDGDKALAKVLDALNESKIPFHSENALELRQHIEIMQLQDQLRYEKDKATKLVEALDKIANSPIPTNESEMASWIETARTIANNGVSEWEGKEVEV